MGAKWLRVETDFVDHPKVFNLGELLGTQLAATYVLRLWSFVSRFCPTGHLKLSHVTACVTACDMARDKEKFLNALVETGFLDPTDDGFLVHNWDSHQSKVANKAENDRVRQQNYRAKKKAEQHESRELSQSVTRDSHSDKRDSNAQRDVTGRNVRRVKTAKSDASASNPSLFPEPERSAVAVKVPDPNFTPTRAKLEAAFLELRGSEYYFNGQKDGPALSSLLKRSESDEILRRWKLGLQEKKFPIVNEIPQLLQHWNSFANLKVEKIPREHLPMRRL